MESFVPRYIAQSEQLIKTYLKEEYPRPFHLHLKTYFKENRRGSRDRRFIRNLSFSLLKLAFIDKPKWEDLIFFLEDSRVIEEVEKYVSLNQEESLQPIPNKGVKKLFDQHISKNVSIDTSHYLKLETVWVYAVDMSFNDFNRWLIKNGVKTISSLKSYECVQVSKSELEKLSHQPKKWGVQDLSSIKAVADVDFKSGSVVWETCCGMGSKTRILNKKPAIKLYISDNRPEAVKHTLRRFQNDEPSSSVIDLSQPQSNIPFKRKSHTQDVTLPGFDYIVADVPCSGSGTWRKNPEHFIGFEKETLNKYVQLQRQIVENSLPFLKQGGKIIYITCSVFTPENEDQISFFQTLGLKVKEQSYLHQTENNTDILYRLILEKES